ncbi:hypothetical protein [Aestuariivirga sp.]|uniref:hypothetical protein n=1 Tax=Aestuariivirga sp. TaxID=2650926 RepID=UPI0039198D5A
MRLIRLIMVLAAAGFLMPSPPEGSSRAEAIASYCPADQGLCGTAAYLAERLQAKAVYSAGIMYEWALNATLEPGALTGRLEARADLGRSTLRPEDLAPAWRGPVARAHKEG